MLVSFLIKNLLGGNSLKKSIHLLLHTNAYELWKILYLTVISWNRITL